jgi:HSP20 family molecular chaperone IbpA
MLRNCTDKPMIRRELLTMFDAPQEEFRRSLSQPMPMLPSRFSCLPTRCWTEPHAWTPAVDVFENEDMPAVKAEPRGVTKERIEITLEQGDLIVRVERKVKDEVEEESSTGSSAPLAASTAAFSGLSGLRQKSSGPTIRRASLKCIYPSR